LSRLEVESGSHLLVSVMAHVTVCVRCRWASISSRLSAFRRCSTLSPPSRPIAPQPCQVESCARRFQHTSHTLGSVCQVFFWDLVSRLPHNPANGKPDRDLLIAVCGQDVLHSSCQLWNTLCCLVHSHSCPFQSAVSPAWWHSGIREADKVDYDAHHRGDCRCHRAWCLAMHKHCA
jgi:hypothetical protein